MCELACVIVAALAGAVQEDNQRIALLCIVVPRHKNPVGKLLTLGVAIDPFIETRAQVALGRPDLADENQAHHKGQ